MIHLTRQTVEKLDLLEWLAAQPHEQKFYWASRDQELQIAGAGVAHEVICRDDNWQAFRDLCQSLQGADADLRYFGGARFDLRRRAAPEWAAFGTYRFVLPAIEVRRTAAETTITENQFLGSSHLDSDVGGLDSWDEPEDDNKSWGESVGEILENIARGNLKKVVLARRKLIPCSDALSQFRSVCERTPSTYQFYFQPDANHAFFGASPERLYHRSGRRISTEAQAGTRKRGATAAEDLYLENDLIGSEKDGLEHQLVRDHVEQTLRELCVDSGIINHRGVVKTSRVQHLKTTLGGVLREAVCDVDILQKLHPTPAVGGAPKELAMNRIAQLESFDRGYYAGPIGLLGADEVDFAVALRCGLCTSGSLNLYAGAGIVQGSDAQKEFAETELKMSVIANGNC